MHLSPSRRRQAAGIALALLVVAVTLSPSWRAYSTFPRYLQAFEGHAEDLLFGLPFKLYLSADRPGLQIDGRAMGPRFGPIDGRRPFRIGAATAGNYNVVLSLFGVIPVRHMALEVLPGLELVPGGQSIGIILRAEGILVAGYRGVLTPSGTTANPGQDAGVLPGDLIVAVDGQPVLCEDELAELVDRAGKRGSPVLLGIRRNGRAVSLEVMPAPERHSGMHRLGLVVRDGTAGVGTLTFYHPQTNVFAALGHVVTDLDTNRPVDIRDGTIVDAVVARIRQGRRGYPGEKVGQLRPDSGSTLGVIERNTPFGIVGRLVGPLPAGVYDTPVPLGLAHQVRRGPAELLTVVEGNLVESFEIEITRVDLRQQQPTPRGMTVRVTDRRLLGRTGGIVQGMSGSPIIQQGKLVGAVTHVFITDPTRGYAVFAEWMAKESGLVGRGASTGQRGITLLREARVALSQMVKSR